MSHIEQHHIHKHQTRLKHIEEHLVPHHRTQRRRVPRDGLPVDMLRLEELHRAEHAPRQDQRVARVQVDHDLVQVPVPSDAMAATREQEMRRQGHEEGDHAELDYQRRPEQVVPDGLLVGAQGLVCHVARAAARDALHHGGEEGECAEDAAWVDRRVVGDVVEDAAEEVEVGEFVERADRCVTRLSAMRLNQRVDIRASQWRGKGDLRRSKSQTDRHDVLDEITITPRAETPEDEANSVQQPTEDKQARQPP